MKSRSTLILALTLASLILPLAAADEPLPAGVEAHPILPSDDCPDCIGASAAAHAGFTQGCADCPTESVAAYAAMNGGTLYGEVSHCRSGFIHYCTFEVGGLVKPGEHYFLAWCQGSEPCFFIEG